MYALLDIVIVLLDYIDCLIKLWEFVYDYYTSYYADIILNIFSTHYALA